MRFGWFSHLLHPVGYLTKVTQRDFEFHQARFPRKFDAGKNEMGLISSLKEDLISRNVERKANTVYAAQPC